MLKNILSCWTTSRVVINYCEVETMQREGIIKNPTQRRETDEDG